MLRLTLRTLLAYVDDMLEPAEARDMGQRIQASPMALSLMTRLREVVRRRRLTAAAPEGGDGEIEPNDSAEYLDSVLPSERIADFEKVCIASDVALAEVAAVHQILAIALSDPMDATPDLKQRAYAVGTGTSTAATAAASREESRGSRLAIPMPVTRAVTPRSVEDNLPEYMRRQPGWGWVVPVLLLAMVLVAVMSISDFRSAIRPRDTAAQVAASLPNEPSQTRPAEDTTNSAEETATTTQAPAPADAKPAMTAPSVAAAGSTNPLPAPVVPELPPDPAPPADLPDRLVTPNAAVAKPVPVGVDVAMKPTTPTIAIEPSPPKPALPQPPEELPPTAFARDWAMSNLTADGMFLRWRPSDRHWRRVKPGAAIAPLDHLACPEPFEATLELPPDGARLLLLPMARVMIDGAVDDLPAVVVPQLGRLILQGSRTEPRNLSIGIRFGEQVGRLDIIGQGAAVAIETAIAETPPGAQQPLVPITRLSVAAGVARWSPAEGAAIELLAGKSLWMNDGRLDDGPLPEWLDPQRRRTTSALRRFAAQFDQEFGPDQAAELTATALAKDPRPKISELATDTLVVTGNIPGMAQAFAQSSHEETWQAAAAGLRVWLALQPSTRGPLLTELASLYNEGEAQMVLRLLGGMTLEEARDPIASMEVVDLLQHNRAEIRELAILNLARLTGRRYDFRSMATRPQRNSAQQRWINHLEREGGALLKP